MSSITLSSKGKVAVSTKSSVLLFDPPPSFALKKEIQAGGSGAITATSFTSKGTDVVSGGADGFVKWWQVETGEEVCATQFPQAEGNTELAVQEVSCSKAGFVAATSGRYGLLQHGVCSCCTLLWSAVRNKQQAAMFAAATAAAHSSRPSE